jgi:uncharacterized protein (TIGR03085 family)
MPVTIAQSERQALCDLFESKGPLAPTLCEGWTTSDLAAHLYVREAKPFSSPGIMFPQFGGATQRAMDAAKADLGYAGLIKTLRGGPPYPFRLVDGQMNGVEYFVHHEDVRRAEDNCEPRVDRAIDDMIWPRIRLGARLMARKFKAGGLRLVASGYGTVDARPGGSKLFVTAGPQELMLLLFGRQKAAVLELEGPDGLKTALYATTFGL